ncbi:MAG: phosphoadenosine phosphosulfate reductase family protein [Candidatus Pacearchaeota archaeon]|jgi:predicted phosphoadenosine phosphosulfate sulfurtransferase
MKREVQKGNQKLMKVYKKQNVFEAALDRIRYVYDEFDNVIIAFSGGKDSTVILELAIIVAKEKNRLPVNVYWIDQEAELQSTADYCERTFNRKEVKPFWFQIPFKLFNSASFFDEWLYCWDDKNEDKWIRKKSEISYKENVFGTDRFKLLFPLINSWIVKQLSGEDKNSGTINGLKCDESMARKKCLTSKGAYKDISWSIADKNDRKKNNIRFSPLYDWSAEDIWVAINKNKWDYNPYYDKVYQLGGQISKMRVSSVIHETSAEHHLMLLQQIEPETYNKLTKRIGGISAYSKLLEDVRVKELPSMFGSWEEYILYLIENVIKESQKEKYYKMIKRTDIIIEKCPYAKEDIYKDMCPIILANDFEGVKFENLMGKFKLKYKYDLK